MLLILEKKKKIIKDKYYEKLEKMDKLISKNKYLSKIIKLNIDKSWNKKLEHEGEKLEQNHKLDFSATTVSPAVIELARTLSKGLKNDRNFEVFDGGKNIVPTFEDDLYILCLNFIKANLKENNCLPSSSDVEDQLDINKRKRLELYKLMEDNNVIRKVNSRTYELVDEDDLEKK